MGCAQKAIVYTCRILLIKPVIAGVMLYFLARIASLLAKEGSVHAFGALRTRPRALVTSMAKFNGQKSKLSIIEKGPFEVGVI